MREIAPNHISSDKPPFVTEPHDLKQRGQEFSTEGDVVAWDYLQKVNGGFSQGLWSIF